VNKFDFEFYGWNTPNGQKIIIALEEAGAIYRYHPINISKGEQKTSQYRRISPDGKIPALIVNSEPAVSYFESGAILLYLASVFPELHGKTEIERAQVMSWTLWQAGQLGPLAGQFGRFSAAYDNPAAVVHFDSLLWRCLDVLEKRLSNSPYLAGSSFTAADIATLPWIASKQSYLQIYDVAWREKCPSLTRWADSLMSKASVVKALGLNPGTAQPGFR